jgi:hypothetical protein
VAAPKRSCLRSARACSRSSFCVSRGSLVSVRPNPRGTAAVADNSGVVVGIGENCRTAGRGEKAGALALGAAKGVKGACPTGVILGSGVDVGSKSGVAVPRGLGVATREGAITGVPARGRVAVDEPRSADVVTGVGTARVGMGVCAGRAVCVAVDGCMTDVGTGLISGLATGGALGRGAGEATRV